MPIRDNGEVWVAISPTLPRRNNQALANGPPGSALAQR